VGLIVMVPSDTRLQCAVVVWLCNLRATSLHILMAVPTLGMITIADHHSIASSGRHHSQSRVFPINWRVTVYLRHLISP